MADMLYFMVWFVGSVLWFHNMVVADVTNSQGWAWISTLGFLVSSLMVITQHLHALGL